MRCLLLIMSLFQSSSYNIEIPPLPSPVTPTPAKHSEDYDFIMAQTDHNYFETSCDKDSLITGKDKA